MARILVIEDNATNLELMVYLLQAFGHTPLAAGEGEGGLEMARRERPDLIICDVQMPRIDGYTVAQRLKDDPALRTISLVAVTALAMVGDRDRVLMAGFDGYIAKPIDPETFVGQVEAFLRPGQPLPPRPARLHCQTGEREPSTPARRATVLVVDNSPPNIQFVRAVMEPYGYEIIAAEEVTKALVLVRQTFPDLIISDVHMPGASGFAFMQAVKADPQLRSIPFVFLSSTVWSDEDRRTALTLGADKFIARPIEPQTLLAEIEACLKK